VRVLAIHGDGSRRVLVGDTWLDVMHNGVSCDDISLTIIDDEDFDSSLDDPLDDAVPCPNRRK
jgi:hypothetical protein